MPVSFHLGRETLFVLAGSLIVLFGHAYSVRYAPIPVRITNDGMAANVIAVLAPAHDVPFLGSKC